MRRSYVNDPRLSDQVFELLDQVFTDLRQAARVARAFGTVWEDISTPYVTFADGRVVAHLGLIELPLIIDGQAKTVGSIHAVATHPEYRRRGYYRQLMEQVLADARDRYEILILTTENPEYYEPFGFRWVGEHKFTVPWSDPAGDDGLRRLAPDNVDDLALLHHLLAVREPVSSLLGVGPEHAVFCFNECPRPLYLLPDLEVILWSGKGGDQAGAVRRGGPGHTLSGRVADTNPVADRGSRHLLCARPSGCGGHGYPARSGSRWTGLSHGRGRVCRGKPTVHAAPFGADLICRDI
ncbi:MAG: GNAT family N-acetyltransferase, partial [bacterium]